MFKHYKLFGGPLDCREVLLAEGAETFCPTPDICYDRKAFSKGDSNWVAFVLRDNEEQDNKDAYKKAAKYFDALCQLGKPAKLEEYHPFCAECAYLSDVGLGELCGVNPEPTQRCGAMASCKEFKQKVNP